MKFKFLEHTADIMFEAYGKNLEEVFSNSAFALKEIMFSKIKIKEKVLKKIEISGKDNESLLYKFLEEFLFLLDAKSFIFSKIKSISIKNEKLTSSILGDNSKNYKFVNNVKAITYNSMFVKKIKDKFVVRAVVDV